MFNEAGFLQVLSPCRTGETQYSGLVKPTPCYFTLTLTSVHMFNLMTLFSSYCFCLDVNPQTPVPAAEPMAPKLNGPRITRSLDPVLPCQRHPLSVDFEEIGWSGWIISPRGYNAYHCKGSCPFPLGENMRPTNHATVQSIINALKLSEGVNSPCCVPDKLFSINLLYFDDDENVVLKQYDDMVAGSCGCH